MKPLVIFGAGGLGRELIGWIRGSSNGATPRWQVSGFVDDAATPGARCADLPVYERAAVSAPRYLLAIGSPSIRQRLAGELRALGWEAETWVHESVVRGVDVEVGEGSVVMPHCLLASGARLGRFVLSIGQNGIGHDADVGDFSVLLGQVSLGGGVTIGKCALVGSGAVIHPEKRVGDGATVGIGSVVLRDVPQGMTVFGNPARRMPQSRRQSGAAKG
jgi:acetyltransferase EpsM